MNKEITFAIDELDILMAKVARVHGDHHPELINIKECYDTLKPALLEDKFDIVKAELQKASELSNNFTLPKDACSAYTRVFEAFKILVKEVA